jgi:hypothetical protein
LIEDESVLCHRPSHSYLSITQGEKFGLIAYQVKSFVVDGPNEQSEGANWDQVLLHVRKWARETAYVTDTPDLWAELQRVPEVLTAAQAAEASNAPFTPDEQAQIARRLDEVKNLVQEKFQLTDDQLASIDQRLDDAEEASQRLGRRDWIMLFYGAVISTGMTDAVPPSVIQTVLSTVVHGIAHIFGFGGPPPMIGV